MSRLDGTQLQGGLQLTYGSVSFSPDAGTSPQLGNNGGGNAIGALPAASGFYVYDLSEKWKVGLGMLNYFGLAEKYDDNWVGRYYVQNSALLGLSIMPSASFKATDWLSIGAGLNAMYGYLATDVAINNGSPVDGQLKLKDETWGFGANLGVLIEPREGTRIGVTYLSPISLDFKDRPEITVFGGSLGTLLTTPELNLGVKVPLSAAHDRPEDWVIDAATRRTHRFRRPEGGRYAEQDLVEPSEPLACGGAMAGREPLERASLTLGSLLP